MCSHHDSVSKCLGETKSPLPPYGEKDKAYGETAIRQKMDKTRISHFRSTLQIQSHHSDRVRRH